MRKNIILLLAVILTASSLFSSPRLKTTGIFSDKFFEQGIFTYNNGEILFVKHFSHLNYIASDTVLLEYSSDMIKMDTVITHYEFVREGMEGIEIADDSYLFYTNQAIIQAGKKSKDAKVHKTNAFFASSILKHNNDAYVMNDMPTSHDGKHIWIQRVFSIEGNNVKSAKDVPLKIPPVLGFSMMLVQPREAVAIFGDTIAVADPCFENIYYYDFTGKLLYSFRADSLLGITGSCAKFKTFKQDKKVLQRNFDDLMEMNTAGEILRSINNYKGKLMLRVATGYEECSMFLIDPKTREWKKQEFTNMADGFSAEDIPIDNFTEIDGDYMINTIQSDIKSLDLSQFKSYEEFKKYTEENKSTGTSYLVREIVFD